MTWKRFAMASILGLASGCAFDIAHVQQSPATLSQSSAARQSFVLERSTELDIGLGYRRTLKAGTTWTYVGTVPAGDVYRTRDQVLTLEASNIHEAYIVINDRRLVGFYLPVEKTYSEAIQIATLPIK